MSSEYDLEKSAKGIGQLYPILEAKDGEIIDGVHRDKADKNWKRVKLEHIDTEEKKLVARLVSNFHRRIVPHQEKKDWINGLAEIYRKKGVKRIARKIQEEAYVSLWTVYQYLNDEYKDRTKQENRFVLRDKRMDVGKQIVVEAAHHRLTKDKAEELVERHREEVKQELVKDPEFQRRVIEQIRKPQPRIVTPTEACPSGVCELPNKIEATKPVDVIAERTILFWKQNPNCLCKGCNHFEECKVIR